MTALPSAPCQSSEIRKQDVAHHREMALNTLSEIANVFDFPDLNRFLTVSCSVCVCVCVCVVDLFEGFISTFHLFHSICLFLKKTLQVLS
jgi:hypothetical protein